MAAPQVVWIVVHNQQTFSVVPTVAENVVVRLALSSLLFFTQAVPLAMGMFLQQICDRREGYNAIAGCLEEKAIVNIHQAVEAELFVDPAYF